MAIYLDDSIEKNIVTGYKIAGRSVGVQLGDLINLIDPTGGKVNDFIASGGDINEFADDNEAGDVYGKWRTNQFKELEKLREKNLSNLQKYYFKRTRNDLSFYFKKKFFLIL